MSDLTLVPPARLGALLSRARLDQNASLEEISGRSAGLWTPFDLEEVERGRRPLTDDVVAKLGSIYGISTSRIVPVRTDLRLDLDQRNLAVGSSNVTLDSAEVDDVLERYLALLYLLRNVDPGNDLTLRDADMAVLSETLQVELARLEQRLGELMLGGAVPTRSRLFSRRVVVPAAGLLVAVTAIGSLVLVGQNSSPPSMADSSSAAAFVTPATQLPETPFDASGAADATASMQPLPSSKVSAPQATDSPAEAGANSADAGTDARNDFGTDAGNDFDTDARNDSDTDGTADAERIDSVSEIVDEDSTELIPAVTIEAGPAAAATTVAEQPTIEPIVIPTATAAPTAEPAPTSSPTPTVASTVAPAVVAQPTAVPAPTVIATPVPTALPTAIPTTPPAPTAIPTAAPVVAQPVATTFNDIGAQAEALISYNWRGALPGWTVNYQGERAGYRGLTNTSSKTIDIYIKSNDNAWSIAGILTHEIAHAIDVDYMTSAQREQWLTARGMPMQWWPGSGAPDFSVGAGDFAEAVAAYLVGSPSDSRYGAFTHEQLQLAASFLP